MEEQAEATEDLIAVLTENHTRLIEMLIKSTTDAMKEMMQLVKNQTTMQSNPTPIEEKKKKYNGRKKFWDAPVCTHCGRKHPSKKED